MKLMSIQNIVRDSSNEEWSRAQGAFGRDVRFYNEDVNLRAEIWYHEDAGTHKTDFKEAWANKHPDPSATSYYVFLFYGSSPIKQYILVAVDGGRALIPLPKVPEKTISKEDYLIASLFDDIKTLDQYIKRSGLAIE